MTLTKNSKMRLCIVLFLFITLYIIALVHLYILQIHQNNFFMDMGKQQYNVTVTQKPPRAEIFDRHGQPLAMNKDTLAAFIIPNKLQDKIHLKKFLAQHFPQALERLNNLNNNSAAHFMYIKRRLSPEQIALIKRSNLSDIQFLNEPSRFYPVESAGTLIGITDSDNEGLFGIELQCNKTLAGTPSTYSLEQEARSGHFYFKRETKVQGVTGTPITLTIDADLQFLAYQELKETVELYNSSEGSVIILDPTTGDILVMANYPDFDPNHTESIDLEKTKNKIITDVHEFGSVMKVFPAIAALEEGVVTPDELIDCENTKTTYIDGIKINTWKGHGTLTYAQVIELSNNIGTSKVTKRLGPVLYDHLRRFGFAQKTNIPFPGEQKGFINPPPKWSKQSLFSLSFGYELNATLLQLASAFGIIANNGYSVKPRLLLQQDIPKKGLALYSAPTMAIIRDMLQKTVTEGTAHKAHIEGYTVMGKTGTANLLINGQYAPEHNIFTFAGIVEKDAYKRVIVTFIKEANKKNIYASTVAAPLFERIAQKMLIHDKEFINPQ